jgi:formylglycine-generating enzyme required for sulfatase activity
MMDKYEVTYAEYKGFLEENPEWRKGKVDIDFASLDYLHDWEALSYPEERDNHPIVYISWYAAMAYAEWAGKTLPTEAQWEYASRGSFKNMDYPWGKEFKSHLTRWRGSKLAGSAQVGRYTINGFGLHDVIGNAGEWTSDGYELYQPGAQINPSSPLNRHLKVIRGGSWKSAQADLRVSARRAYAPNICLPDVGFRCVLAL